MLCSKFSESACMDAMPDVLLSSFKSVHPERATACADCVLLSDLLENDIVEGHVLNRNIVQRFVCAGLSECPMY